MSRADPKPRTDQLLQLHAEGRRHLEAFRNLFKADLRDRLKLTLIVRDPADNERDVVITNDDKAGLTGILGRRVQ